MNEAAIGIIGGSGLYQIPELAGAQEISVDTPFGSPSDSLVQGEIAGRRVYFLPRHGRGHRILPTELNHRANVYALRSLGVRWILSISAVGSLQEQYPPRSLLLPNQFFDRTSRRSEATFFGHGIVAHISLAEPTSQALRRIVQTAAQRMGVAVHDGGTYVNIDGPAFSTRAESRFYRQMGFDVIGMTNFPEAKLAREAEIALATLSLVTDYDCWREEEAPVSAQAVFETLTANAETAKRLLPAIIADIPKEPNWPEHRSLDNALVTDRNVWPPETFKKLQPILARFL
jgi:5'-methylthioadenosine phosphorylase